MIENINEKRDIIKTYCANLELELMAALEAGRTLAVENFHLKNDMISTGIIKISVTVPEAGFISLESERDDFKFHKDLPGREF